MCITEVKATVLTLMPLHWKLFQETAFSGFYFLVLHFMIKVNHIHLQLGVAIFSVNESVCFCRLKMHCHKLRADSKMSQLSVLNRSDALIILNFRMYVEITLQKNISIQAQLSCFTIFSYRNPLGLLGQAY